MVLCEKAIELRVLRGQNITPFKNTLPKELEDWKRYEASSPTSYQADENVGFINCSAFKINLHREFIILKSPNHE